MTALLDTIGTYAMVPVHYVAETVEEAYDNIVWAGRSIKQACIDNKDKIFRVFEKYLANAPAIFLLQLLSIEARVITYCAIYLTAIACLIYRVDQAIWRLLRPFPLSFGVDIAHLVVWLTCNTPLPVSLVCGGVYGGYAFFVAYVAANAEHL